MKEMLRDRLVCGVNPAGIQRKLLAELLTTRQSHWPLPSERDSRNLRDASQKPNPGSINYQAAGGVRNAGGGWMKTPDHPKP